MSDPYPHALLAHGATAGPSGDALLSPSLHKPACCALGDPMSLSPSPTTHPFLDPPPPSRTLYPNTHPHTQTTELDMPLFSLRGLFGRSGASAATGPSTPTMSYSTFHRGARAQSEPLPTHDEDVEMAPAIPRSRSEVSLPLSGDVVMQLDDSATCVGSPLHLSNIMDQIQHPTPITQNMIEETLVAQDETLGEEPLGEDSEDQSQTRPRAPSPVPTEVDDPDAQDVMADIILKGVKIRDFAYVNQTPPAASTSQAPDPTPPILTQPVLPYKPAPEIFDQYKGFAEVEFRWCQATRIYPVAGKTLRRLLNMGWITQAEVDERAHPMDLDALREHDARPPYPWRPYRWTSVPCLENRRDMARARTGMFNQLDRIRAASESAEQKRRIETAQAEALLAQYEEQLRKQREQIARARAMQEARWAAARAREQEAGSSSTSPGRNKRRLHPTGTEDADSDDGENATADDTGSPKKRRLTPSPTEPDLDPRAALAAAQQQRFLLAPAKQYPAPLHTYDPLLYPEAASIIESSAATASQPRPVVPPPPERTDTPPLDEEAERREAEPESPGRRGAKLVHPRERKAMKRALSRTQTFAQLIV